MMPPNVPAVIADGKEITGLALQGRTISHD
jgi:hypothetical protein